MEPNGTSGDRAGPPGSPVRPGKKGAAPTVLWRAARLRCPNCGGGPLFRRWLIMREACPSCHLILDRGEPDYFLGGYVINFVTAELLIVLGGMVAVVLTWPDVPWSAIKWGLMALMIPAPVVFYPFAKTLWLGTDLLFRPPTLRDLRGHGENLPPDDRGGP